MEEELLMQSSTFQIKRVRMRAYLKGKIIDLEQSMTQEVKKRKREVTALHKKSNGKEEE